MDKIDNAAHTLIDFRADKAWIEGGHSAYYHEDRLYSVRDTKSGIVSLVHAKSPADAIGRVKRAGRVNFKVISAEGFMEKVHREAEALNDEDADKLLMWAEWILDKTPDVFSGELEPTFPDEWIRTADKQPDKPTGPEYYSFEGVDIAADEYNVMIEGATQPTSAHWTGSCWFDPYGPIEQLLPVIAWRPLPDPPSWALQDPEHEEGDLPFPEVEP